MLARLAEKGETMVRRILDGRADREYLLFVMSQANIRISVTDISMSVTGYIQIDISHLSVAQKLKKQKVDMVIPQ